MAVSAQERRGEQTGRNGGNWQQYRTQQVREDQDRLMGNWISADESDNTVQFAETNDPDLLAIRNSFNHGRVIYATRDQLRECLRSDRVRGLANA